MFNGWNIILFFFCTGVFICLSTLFGGLAWLMFGPEVAKWVFITGNSFGLLWTIYCYMESQ